jgi:hypothetical protein
VLKRNFFKYTALKKTNKLFNGCIFNGLTKNTGYVQGPICGLVVRVPGYRS